MKGLDVLFGEITLMQPAAALANNAGVKSVEFMRVGMLLALGAS